MLNDSLQLATLAFRVPPILTLAKTSHLLLGGGGGGGAPAVVTDFSVTCTSQLQPAGGASSCLYSL